jgi:hypothetical protein
MPKSDEEGLIWWRDNPKRQYVTQEEFSRVTGRPEPKYVRLYDKQTGLWYEMSLTVSGHLKPRTQRIKRLKDKRDHYIVEMMYTEYQYELINWSLWMMAENNWTYQEVYGILSLVWKHRRGQMPLVPRTIVTWAQTQKFMRKRGFLWP